MEPTREIYWNISWGILVYPAAIVAIAIMALGIYSRVARWRSGRPSDSRSEWTTATATRLRSILVYAIGQARVLREPYAGLMHLLIFWGFIVLFIGTLLVMVHEDFRIRILQGTFYLFYSLTLDIFGLAAIVGITMAAFRRYAVKAKRLDEDKAFAVAIAFIFVILGSGFLVEGLRIAATELEEHPDWAAWSPVGMGVALLVQGFGEPALLTLHRVGWWLHMFVAFGFIAYCVGWATQSHIFLGPLNIYLRRLGPAGALRSITDFKDKRALGGGSIQDTAWKNLVDSDVCLRCGRCHENCPAALTGKALSPRAIVQKIRRQMERETAGLPWTSRSEEAAPILDGNISEEEIWSCTTCGACHYECPVFVEPMSEIMELRRHSVMVKGKLPETAQVAMMSLQKRGHPWTGTPHMRTEWFKDIEVRQAADAYAAEGKRGLLFWVGCSGALVDRNMLVSQAMARVLKIAGVEFSVLGSEETCCGDPARRIGNEYLFQTLAKKNIKVLQQYGVRTILTTCAHCFNTLKNEYPEFGGEFQVIHHTELIANLLKEGKLKPKSLPTAGFSAETLTYHDPCYLSRHNQVLDSPRLVARSVGNSFREMNRSRERSFCCGGGGGRSWMEETTGTRINHERTRQALGAGASVVGTACPFCLQMFEEGIGSLEAGERIKALDLAELVEMSLA